MLFFTTKSTRTLRSLLRMSCGGLFTLLLISCSPSEERQAKLIDIHIKQAETYRSSGQYRAAVIEARNVIQKAPQRSVGYTLLAGVLVDLGQYKNALALLERAPEKNSRDAQFNRYPD